MRQAGGGSIINIASVSGHRAGFSAHSYTAAKAALIHLTRSVAVELGESGVRVNSLSPGPIVTGIFVSLAVDALLAHQEAVIQQAQRVLDRIP